MASAAELIGANATPWHSIVRQFPVGRVVEATIDRHASFGSFVNLEDLAQGFIDPIERPQSLGAEGVRIWVKVVDHRADNRQVRVVPASPAPAPPDPNSN